MKKKQSHSQQLINKKIQESINQQTKKKTKIQEVKKAKKQETKPEVKTEEKKTKQKLAIDYQNKARLNYQRERFYQQRSVDYEKLYSTREYRDPYQQFINSLKESGVYSNDTLSEEELERIIKKEQLNLMLRNSLDQITVEEKEKYKSWKDFNRMWNMLKIDMQRVANAIPGIFYV